MITLLITIAVIGFIVYVIVTYIPMPALFRNVIIVIAVVLILIYLLNILGFRDIPIR